jgi:hypothetical protein
MVPMLPAPIINSVQSGLIRTLCPSIAFIVLMALGLTAAPSGLAASLSNPEVDRYNVRVGTQTFAGLYQFTSNSLLVETAQAISSMGSDILKFYLGSATARQYGINRSANVTNLLTLARDEPSFRHALDLPFRHVIAWAYPFANGDSAWADGYSNTERTNEYREIYDLTRYLLTNYSGSGKTFYLGHWEGDGYLMPWTTNARPITIQGMIAWLNNRQQAIDDAKAASLFTNVAVYGYAEVNRVRDAMLNGPNNNVRVINHVIPFVTNLDFLSYSSYDAMNLNPADLYATLNYISSKLATNKASQIQGPRIWIGEYGWGGTLTPSQQEPITRNYIRRLLNYEPAAMPFILFWEIYNNEPSRNYCLIASNQVKTAVYHLHEGFINRARLLVARFRETHGRLPTAAEFVALVDPILAVPLPSPVNLTVSNNNATAITGTGAELAGLIEQGVYGDEAAAVSVCWGQKDGGTIREDWDHLRDLGINTNFNPKPITVALTNLAPDTRYYFRFHARNQRSETWAASSSSFRTAGTAQPPALSLVLSNRIPTLTWPVLATDFELWWTSNLTYPIAWAPVTNTAVLARDEWQVLVSTTGPSCQFYRLQAHQ